jgi:hypothetical protein
MSQCHDVFDLAKVADKRDPERRQCARTDVVGRVPDHGNVRRSSGGCADGTVFDGEAVAWLDISAGGGSKVEAWVWLRCANAVGGDQGVLGHEGAEPGPTEVFTNPNRWRVRNDPPWGPGSR